MRSLCTLSALAVLALLEATFVEAADVYRCNDAEGRPVFSQRPCGDVLSHQELSDTHSRVGTFVNENNKQMLEAANNRSGAARIAERNLTGDRGRRSLREQLGLPHGYQYLSPSQLDREAEKLEQRANDLAWKASREGGVSGRERAATGEQGKTPEELRSEAARIRLYLQGR
jgi:hypothetical protein